MWDEKQYCLQSIYSMSTEPQFFTTATLQTFRLRYLEGVTDDFQFVSVAHGAADGAILPYAGDPYLQENVSPRVCHKMSRYGMRVS